MKAVMLFDVSDTHGKIRFHRDERVSVRICSDLGYWYVTGREGYEMKLPRAYAKVIQ